MKDALQRAADEAAVAWVRSAAEWDLVATLTFAAPVSEETGGAALRGWLRAIARGAGHHVAYAYVEDAQPDSGRWHFHVVLSFLGAPRRDDLARSAWRSSSLPTGLAEVQPYKADSNTLAYMVKGHEWAPPNIACPRTGACAHRRCSHAAGGWK